MSKAQNEDFDDLIAAWAVDGSKAWTYLKAVTVEQHSLPGLRRIVHAEHKHQIEGDPAEAIDRLRGFFDEHAHVDLSGPQVWSFLEGIGSRRRNLAGDTNTAARLHRTLERQQRRVATLAPTIGLVPSSNPGRILDAVTDPDGPRLFSSTERPDRASRRPWPTLPRS